ncbi:MAG TPA: hypothetical protein VFS07_07990 [Gemmatimonadales bacterium]|nr:hypothetical protein [Gemmatimonadales bacterium]
MAVRADPGAAPAGTKSPAVASRAAPSALATAAGMTGVRTRRPTPRPNAAAISRAVMAPSKVRL